MNQSLTQEQKDRVLTALETRSGYKQLQTPTEFHQFALAWNWDDGFKPLQWIINQPQCDRGTALSIYWHAAPTWFCQFGSRDEIIAASEDVKLYDFIKEIETKFSSNFYQSASIHFDPKNDEGTDWTQDYSDKNQKRTLPELMFQATAGEAFPRMELIELGYRDLTEAEINKVEVLITKGFQILWEKGLDVTPTTEPRLIAMAIKDYVDLRRQETKGKLRRNDVASYVAWVFGEQIRRRYNWQWQHIRLDKESQINLLSPDHIYRIYPPLVIILSISRYSWDNNVLRFYDTIATAQKTQDFRDFYVESMIFLNQS